MNVTFKYKLDQTVVTPFGDKGIVTVCGVNDGGNTYYVTTQTGGNWFKEAQLSE